MKLKMLTLAVITAAFILSVTGAEALSVNEPAPNFTLTDSNGNTHSLSDFKNSFVVLEWVNFDCPFVKKHYQSGNMQKLQKDATEQGVTWLSINSSAEGKQGAYSQEQVNEIIANSEASPTAYLLDASGDVGRLYGAQTTPHMFVINPSGVLIYQGAIDSIPSFNAEDIPEATNYVTAALTAGMNNQPIEMPMTKAYGCSVKY